MKNTVILILGVLLLGLVTYVLIPEGPDGTGNGTVATTEGNGMAGRVVEAMLDLYWNPALGLVVMSVLFVSSFLFFKYWKGIED